MSSPAADPSDDPDALFRPNGPINPIFVIEAVRTLMRAMPLPGQAEPNGWTLRRMYCATRAITALHPRDEIELMLGVQAIAAYHAAAACWRVGMNLRQPHGDSTRHISAAATAARTFDTLLKALERRQVKPLSVPAGRPASREWPDEAPAAIMAAFEARCRQGERTADPVSADAAAWTVNALAIARDLAEQDRIGEENAGLDIANTEGILPDGSIIVPEYPTPQQEAYIARRVGLQYKREYADNLRQGINKYPKIRPIRTGDRIP